MKADLFTIGNFTIHSYGTMIGIGIVLAIVLASRRAGNKELDSDIVWNMAIIGAVIGFAGAKLLYVLERLDKFIEDPLSVLGSSGFVVYGGLVIGVLAAFLYCRRKKVVFMDYFDIAAPSIALAQGFGRIGCFLAGCCYGKETDLPIGVVFPEGNFAPAGVSLYPTQLMSAAGDFIICIVLIVFSNKSKRSGNTGALYFMLYGIGRFVIEFFRENTQGYVGILTTAQAMSVGFAVISVILFIRNYLSDNNKDPLEKMYKRIGD